MKVLVTGATGFVGQALLAHLRTLPQFQAHAAVRSSTPAMHGAGIPYFQVGNLDAHTDWQAALAGIDTVIHLAARVHILHDRSPNPLESFRRVNMAGSMRLAQMAVQDSFSAIPSVSTARVELVGENMVVVKDLSNYASGTYLRCIIANDENLSNIKMRSIMAFCKMVELAIKSYIYNEYIITMDQAQLSGGQDLGRFKEIIEGYADSEELLQTFVLEKWQKIALMNDNTQMTRFLKLQIGSMK